MQDRKRAGKGERKSPASTKWWVGKYLKEAGDFMPGARRLKYDKGTTPQYIRGVARKKTRW